MGSPGSGYIGDAAGAGATAYGLSMNPTLQQTNPLQYLSGDQSAIGGASQQQQGITNNQIQGLGGVTSQNIGGQLGINQMGVDQQQGLENQYLNQLQNVDQNQMQQLTSQLGPTGSIGQQLAGEYNNYGITPQSGAFQEGLANQYGNLAMQQQQQLASAVGQGYGNISGSAQTGTNALTGILGQGAQNQYGAVNTGASNQSGLSNLGLQQQFGLEGQQSNASLADSLAQFAQQSGLQQALVKGGLGTIGQSSSGGGK